jgi:uncharacterized membrane protein
MNDSINNSEKNADSATPKTPETVAPETAKPVNTQLLRQITLTGYFGLLILMPIWLIWLNPAEGISTKVSLALFWLPLFFPMRGLIKGTPYTYAWANFMVMLNVMHALTTLWVLPEDVIYASLELLFATMMFTAGTYYARHKGRELGLKLPKLKDQT